MVLVVLRLKKCAEVEQQAFTITKLRKALKHMVFETESNQEYVAHVEKIIGAVHDEAVALVRVGPPLSQRQLLEGLQKRIIPMTVLKEFRSSNPTLTGGRNVDLEGLEREVEVLRQEVRRKEQELMSSKTTMTKEAESYREESKKQLEEEKQRTRKAEAELKKVKTTQGVALKEREAEWAEIQRSTLEISLQYEKQCKHVETLQETCEEARLALAAARTKQSRDTVSVSKKLEVSTKESAALAKQLTVLKKQLKTEVRCRAEVAGQLRSTRIDMQGIQVKLASEETQNRELQRKLKQSTKLLNRLRNQRKADQEMLDGISLSTSNTTLNSEYDGLDPEQVLNVPSFFSAPFQRLC